MDGRIAIVEYMRTAEAALDLYYGAFFNEKAGLL